MKEIKLKEDLEKNLSLDKTTKKEPIFERFFRQIPICYTNSTL
ncbi:Uncharacterised protein [Campylobacter jejuni subsp. doylei]|nr:Uncharacterised protein [Campylobacter jejuni subsp. doylei]